ncbi:hypothetical protein ACIBFB_20050 [Nocardiopsis sp. NPDC050513]|uniref:hypothetical protein n=1 Tax=Nocardiopsis sp. NPDC050513 TaxID=3364338 RepID=UPI003787F1EF
MTDSTNTPVPGVHRRDPANPFIRCNRTFIAAVPVLLSSLLLASCSVDGPEGVPSSDPDSGESAEYVSISWVKREVRVQTLSRMITENDPDEVVSNIDDESRESLSQVRIIRQDSEGYYVELDEEEWRTDAVPNLSFLDQALANAIYPNEVTWCEEAVNGEEFVDTYTDEFRDSFDTHDEYEESIADYVDCGTGELN